MKAFVTISGYDFPEPSSYESTTATLVDSGRNVQGYTVGAVIREDVAKVTLGWKFLTVEQWAKVNQCFLEAYGGAFYNDVTFFNQNTGGWESRKMYVGDRKAGVFRRDPVTEEIVGYVNPSLSLVEV